MLSPYLHLFLPEASASTGTCVESRRQERVAFTKRHIRVLRHETIAIGRRCPSLPRRHGPISDDPQRHNTHRFVRTTTVLQYHRFFTTTGNLRTSFGQRTCPPEKFLDLARLSRFRLHFQNIPIYPSESQSRRVWMQGRAVKNKKRLNPSALSFMITKEEQSNRAVWTAARDPPHRWNVCMDAAILSGGEREIARPTRMTPRNHGTAPSAPAVLVLSPWTRSGTPAVSHSVH